MALPGSHSRLPCLPLWISGVGGELVAQPEIGGEIAVRRDEIGIVVARGLVEMIAARGLQQDGDVAEAERGEVEGVAADEGIGRRDRPSGR